MFEKHVSLYPTFAIQILLLKAYKIALVWYTEARGEESSFATSIMRTEENVLSCSTFTGASTFR
jgi:hypothetical protein